MAWIAPWLRKLTKGMEREMAEEKAMLLEGELRIAREEITVLEVQLDGAKWKRDEIKKRAAGAYEERNLLVCALSKLFPSCLGQHTEQEMLKRGWDKNWGWVVYIELPTGQASWHIRTDELELFEHLEVCGSSYVYDGHTTEEKYRRLDAIQPSE